MLKALHIVGKQPMATERAKAQGSVVYYFLLLLLLLLLLFLSFLRSKEAPRFVLEILGPPNLLSRGQSHERAVTLHFWASLS
jgi:cytochrome b561